MEEEITVRQGKRDLSGFPEPDAPVPLPKDSGWWFTVAGFVLAYLLVAFDQDLPATRVKRCAVAALIGGASLLVVWGAWSLFVTCERLRTRWKKGGTYDELYELGAQHKRDLDESQGSVRSLLAQWPSYTGISYSVIGGRVILEFQKRGRRALPEIGRWLTLFDVEGGVRMGAFQVTQIQEAVCQAEERGDLDAIFRGYVLKEGTKLLPARYALFPLPERNDQDE
jgi:hypothetical protein